MVRFLSPDWIAALDAAAQQDHDLTAATSGVDLVVQQDVTGGPEGDAAWHLKIDHGSVRVLPGRAPRMDVSFTQDHLTAAEVNRGELSAQTAFMTGRLRVGGNVNLLMAHAGIFDAVGDLFATVGHDTEY